MSNDTSTTATVRTAYVRVVDEDYTRSWRNAEIIEDYNGGLEVWRGERKIASFSPRDVSSWYMEEDGDA
jgi:hypothetical protein